MRQLIKTLPYENVIYFGDTARVPYGEKSREAVIRYSVENGEFLIEKNVKMIVVACNTASSHAIEALQQTFSIPVAGVVECGAENAANATKNGKIAVLGTKGTVQSQAYQKAILQKVPQASVFSIACPLLVPLVEEGYLFHPATRLIVQEYLRPLQDKQIDTLLLGCTHYPLLSEVIRGEIKDHVEIVDSASSCANHVASTLSRLSLLKEETAPEYQYFVSDDPKKFQVLGSAFLGLPIEKVDRKDHQDRSG